LQIIQDPGTEIRHDFHLLTVLVKPFLGKRCVCRQRLEPAIDVIMPDMELECKAVVWMNVFYCCIEKSALGSTPVDDKNSFLIGRIEVYPGWWQLRFPSFRNVIAAWNNLLIGVNVLLMSKRSFQVVPFRYIA